jgi:hypothetical protein
LAFKNRVNKHPGWERLKADSQVGTEQKRDFFNFNWQFYKVVLLHEEMAADNLLFEVDSLERTLFGEIFREIKEVWNKVYLGKTEVSPKALSPLKSHEMETVRPFICSAHGGSHSLSYRHRYIH